MSTTTKPAMTPALYREGAVVLAVMVETMHEALDGIDLDAIIATAERAGNAAVLDVARATRAFLTATDKAHDTIGDDVARVV